MDLTALHSYVRTKNDANELISKLEDLTEKIFKNDSKLEDLLNAEFPDYLASWIEKLAKQQAVNIEDKNNLGQFFNQIEETLSSLPVIHLILAVQPSQKFISAIHDWFYHSFKKLVLLDIRCDKSLIGGAVISFAGRANEYSLRNQIEQIS